jgi:hypothetical protein
MLFLLLGSLESGVSLVTARRHTDVPGKTKVLSRKRDTVKVMEARVSTPTPSRAVEVVVCWPRGPRSIMLRAACVWSARSIVVGGNDKREQRRARLRVYPLNRPSLHL